MTETSNAKGQITGDEAREVGLSQFVKALIQQAEKLGFYPGVNM